MDQEVIIDLFNRAKSKGYKKTQDEFVQLLYTDQEVFNDMFSYVKSKGYQKTEDDFSVLIGKKKDVAAPVAQQMQPSQEPQEGMASPSDATSLESPSKKEDEDGQGWILNTVSALDRGFFKNLIGNPVKGLGTLLEQGTGKIFGGSGKGPISDALIDFGNYFNKAIDEIAPIDEEYKNSLSNQFSEAFGQVASLVLTGGVSGTAGKAATIGGELVAATKATAPVVAAVKEAAKGAVSPVAISSGLSMGQAEFERAKEAGASDDQAFEAFSKNAVVGSVLEKIPVTQFLKRFNTASSGGVVNYLKTKGVAGLTGGTEEMTTEVLQQLYANKTAQDIYNVNQDLFEGVGESGGVGFGVGFLLNAMGANARILRDQGRNEEADVVEAQMNEFERQAQNGGPPSYSINGIKITDPKVIDDMINGMTASDLTKANIEIENNPELKSKLEDKIITSSIKEQVRQANPELNEETLDAITDLEKQLRSLEGNTTQAGKDKAAEVRSKIKEIQSTGVVPAELAPTPAPAAPAAAPAAAPEATPEAVQEEVKPIELEKGNEIKWNVYGNEPESTWTVGEKVKTRGGEDAVVLSAVYVESSTDGKSYTKEYADANNIKYDNERTVSHIVPLTEIQTTKQTTDAIQKQAAGQVPVQQAPTAGEAVAQGVPAAGPEVTPTAGVQAEEGVVSSRTLEEQVAALEQMMTEEETNDLIDEFGVSVDTVDDAQAALSRGDLVYVIDETTGTPNLVSDVTMLEGYAADQIVVVPKENSPMAQQPQAQPQMSAEEFITSQITPTDNVFVGSNKAQLDSVRAQTTDATKRRVLDMVDSGVKVLKALFPNIDIAVHTTADSYKQAMQTLGKTIDSKGMFSYVANADGKVVGGRIDIDLSSADGVTVAHEIAHAVMLKAFGDNPTLFKGFRDRISKILADSTVKKLNDFADQYSESESHEEFLVQLAGLLTDNAQELSRVEPTTIQKIADAINQFVSYVTKGRVVPFEGTVRTNQLVDFLNTMTRSIREGEPIDLESMTMGDILYNGVVNPNGLRQKAYRKYDVKWDVSPEAGFKITPPKERVSLFDAVDKSGGAVVITNSDATGVGVTKDGESLQGGIGYTFIDQNVKDEVGFAASDDGKISSIFKAAQDSANKRDAENPSMRGRPVAVFVMIQSGPAMFGNRYGATYFGKVLKRLTGTTKITTKEAKKELIDFIDDYVNVNKKGKDYKASFDKLKSLIKNTDFTKPESIQKIVDLLTTERTKKEGKGVEKFGFDVRRSFFEKFFVGTGKVNPSTTKTIDGEKVKVDNPAVKLRNLLKEMGFGHEAFISEYGDNNFLDLLEGKTPSTKLNDGDFVLTGFYIDPYQSESDFIAKSKSGTFKHNQFNSKFHGVDPFVLDGKVYVNDAFPETRFWSKKKEVFVPASVSAAGSMYPRTQANFADLVERAKRESAAAKYITEYEKADAKDKPVIKSKAQVAVHEDTGFVPVGFWVEQLKGKTGYLDDVVKNILNAREELKDGKVKERKVVKSYLITLASMGSGGGYFKKWTEKTGQKISDLFLEKVKGKDWIRPEGSAAAYLVTPDGEKLVDDIIKGTATPDQIKQLFLYVGVGRENKKTNYVVKTMGTGGLKTMTDLFNKNKGSNFSELYSGAIKNLEGIGQGKTGFFNQYFGVAERGVVDARELNAWIAGSMKLTEEQKAKKKQVAASKKLGDQLLGYIEQVGIELGFPPDLAGYIAHHAIWDGIANSITRHEGEYMVVSKAQVSAEGAAKDKYRVSIVFKSKFGGRNTKTYEFNDKRHFDNWLKKYGDKYDISEIYELKSKAQVASEVKQLEKMPTVVSKAQVEAYHGSPHDFDEFTLSKMGTGEGVQAFGWGLYFTDIKAIAEGYAEKLSKPNFNKFRQRLIKDKLQDNVINDILDFSEYHDYDYDKVLSALIKNKNTSAVNYLKDNKDLFDTSNKKVYQVTLHQGKTPDQYTWLEWDKPVSEKAKNIVRKKEEYLKGRVNESKYVTGKETESEKNRILQVVKNELIDDLINSSDGKSFYGRLSSILGSPKEASLFLLENGIDGNKFPAESIARGATSDTARGFNYVVFDDKAITIVSKAQKRADAKKAVQKTVANARAQGFSEEAIRIFLGKRGFSQDDIDELMKSPEAAKKIKLTEELAPGYDRMMEQVDGIIETGLEVGSTQDEIMNDVIQTIKSSAAYKNATDIQKDQMLRDAEEAFGQKQKAAPRAERGSFIYGLGRLLGFAKKEVKMVTVPEYELLIKGMKDYIKGFAKGEAEGRKAGEAEGRKAGEAKGRREMNAAWKRAYKSLSNDIRALRKSGKISTKQAVAVIRRFSSVNIFDPTSIDSFVNYMTKVFANAEYAEKVAGLRKKLKLAKDSAKRKLGIAEGLYPMLDRMLSIDPTLVPDDVLNEYAEIVEMLGKRDAVLPLKEINDVTQKARTVLDAIDTELSILESLKDIFDQYPNKVLDNNGDVDFAETVSSMISDGTITEDDAKVLRKYKSKVMPKAAATQKTEQQLQDEKDEMIMFLQDADVDADRLPTRDERDTARELAELIQTSALGELSNAELKKLLLVVYNINNGYLTNAAQLMKERLNSIPKSKTLSSSITKAKPLPISAVYSKIKAYLTRKKNAIEVMGQRNPFFYIDQVFGDFKTKDIYNSLFSNVAKAMSTFDTSIQKIEDRLNNAIDSVARSHKNDPNKTSMSSYKMMAYMLQLEHESNPGSTQVNPAAEYLKATIKHIRNGKSHLGDRDADMLQDILDKYSTNDQIDKDRLYDSFNSAEKSALKTIKDINIEMRDKAVFTAHIIRGDKLNPITNYVHHHVMPDDRPDDSIAGISSAEEFNNLMNPSTRGKSLISRTKGVKPLDFDVFSATQRGANYVLMDYHLTEPIRTARKAINMTEKTLEEGGMSKKDRDVFNAIKNSFEGTVRNTLATRFHNNTFMDLAVKFMTKQGYRAVLASTTRFIAELSSNMGFMLIVDPKGWINGVKNYRNVAMSTNGIDIMMNVRSSVTSRIYPSDTLSGRMIDSSIMSQASGIKGGAAKSAFANATQRIYNNSLKKVKNFVEVTADGLISTPDKIMMRPYWFGAFATEFKKITGENPDFDLIASNNEAYMTQYKDAIKASTSMADEKVVFAGASSNPFMGVMKGQVTPNMNSLVKAFNTFNGYMTTFLMYEYATARTGIMAAIGDGYITRKQGAAMLAGVATRMVTYTLLSSMLGEELVGMFVDEEDEEDEKSLSQKVGQAMLSGATSLIVGRDFGNATRSVLNYGVERMNEEFLGALRNGEYDPYKDAIAYSPLISKGETTTLQDYAINMLGPLTPSLKTGSFIVKKATEEPKKEKEAIERREKEIKLRIPLEVLGNLGYVPLYKDIRRIVLADIYKDLKKNKDKKSMGGGVYNMNKEDMKRYFPEMYESMYGEGSAEYEYNKAMKKYEDEMKKIERRMKDEMYNYKPKQSD